MGQQTVAYNISSMESCLWRPDLTKSNIIALLAQILVSTKNWGETYLVH